MFRKNVRGNFHFVEKRTSLNSVVEEDAKRMPFQKSFLLMLIMISNLTCLLFLILLLFAINLSVIMLGVTATDDGDSARSLHSLPRDGGVLAGQDLVGKVVARCSTHDVQTATFDQTVHHLAPVLVQSEPEDGVAQQAEDGDGVAAEPRAVHVGLDEALVREILKCEAVASAGEVWNSSFGGYTRMWTIGKSRCVFVKAVSCNLWITALLAVFQCFLSVSRKPTIA